MTKRVTVDLTIRVKIDMAEDEDVDQILSDMDYDFAWSEGQARTTETEIMDQEVVDIQKINI